MPDNTRLTGYKCFYRGKQCEVYAINSLRAQLEGARILKARKSYDVAVIACERPDGTTIVHSTASL